MLFKIFITLALALLMNYGSEKLADASCCCCCPCCCKCCCCPQPPIIIQPPPALHKICQVPCCCCKPCCCCCGCGGGGRKRRSIAAALSGILSSPISAPSATTAAPSTVAGNGTIVADSRCARSCQPTTVPAATSGQQQKPSTLPTQLSRGGGHN
ncbi:hypothetical protein niasHS_000186 [Heterodera schachtii]|uniref:Uncharacterized protein n=1 Tax=Heterodera schachtii TaxID=97005 RepID=A0ABD2KCA4_HETSC